MPKDSRMRETISLFLPDRLILRSLQKAFSFGSVSLPSVPFFACNIKRVGVCTEQRSDARNSPTAAQTILAKSM